MRRLLPVALLLFAPFALAQGRSIAVLGEDGSVARVNPFGGGWQSTVYAGDPDGLPTTPNRPVCIAASTADPDVLFVAHEDGWISVVDFALGGVLRSYPVFTDLLESGMTLVDCAAAEPRRLTDSAGPRVKHYLHLLGALPSGTVIGVVLDQQVLTQSFGSAFFDAVPLSADGTPLGVVSLNTVAGDAHQRLHYQVGRSDAAGDQIFDYEVSADDGAASPFAVDRVTRYAGSAPFAPIAVGHPYDRELPVMTLPPEKMVNLDNGGTCTVPPLVDDVVVSGAGYNAMTVLALSSARAEATFVDPRSCATTTIATPPGPVGMLFVEELCWDGAYLISRDTDAIYPLAKNGSIGAAISILPPTARATRGPCQACPLGAAWMESACSIEQIDVKLGPFDASPGRDVRITVDHDCAPGTKFRFKCQCFDVEVEDCPCACDCSLPPDQIDPACECGAIPNLQFALDPEAIDSFQGDQPIIGNNPWRKLGDFIADGPVDFSDIGEQGGSWVYTVEPLP